MKISNFIFLKDLNNKDFPTQTKLYGIKSKHFPKFQDIHLKGHNIDDSNLELIETIVILEYYSKFVLVQKDHYKECFSFFSNDLVVLDLKSN